MIVSRVFHVFTRAPGARPALTALCLFGAGLFDILGMSLVIPLLNSIAAKDVPSASPLSQIGRSIIDVFGLPADPGIMLLSIAVALTAKSLLILAAMAYVAYSVAEVGLRLRRQLLAALLRANLSYFTTQTPARIANALVNDVSSAAAAFNSASVAVAELLKLSAILIMAFLIAGWAVLAVLAVVAVVAFLLSQSVKYRRSIYRRQKQASDELIDRASDTFHNIKVLKGMGRLGPLRDAIGSGISDVRQSVFQSQLTRHSLNAFQDILLVAALCGGLYVGLAWLRISMPELILLTTLFLLVGTSIRNLLNILQDFRESLPAFEACESLLAEAHASAEAHAGRRAPSFQSDVVFRNVSFAHGDKQVLSDVSFRIPPGQITVLEGTSGVGKTTTVDLLVGLYRPTSGAIDIGGVPLHEIAMESWRSGIGSAEPSMRTSPWAMRASAAKTSGRLWTSPVPVPLCGICRTASTPTSAPPAPASRVVNVSASPWPGLWPASHICSSSMKSPAHSTRQPSAISAPPLPAYVLRSPSWPLPIAPPGPPLRRRCFVSRI
jgi:ABC-type multidrug transport system fused ATPase/permease subunit